MDSTKFISQHRKLVERKSFIIEKCKNKTVMHLGCTGGLLDDVSIAGYKKSFSKSDDTHWKISQVAKSISGLDISKEKIEVLKNGFQGDFYVNDITDINLKIDKKFEVIVFANLIEHLDNVKAALSNCKRLMANNSILIITTSNAFDFKVIGKLFFRYESVHLEHTAYYSYFTLKRVLEMNGFVISEFYFATNSRNKYDSFLDRISNGIANIFSKIFVQFSSNLVVVANLAEES